MHAVVHNLLYTMVIKHIVVCTASYLFFIQSCHAILIITYIKLIKWPWAHQDSVISWCTLHAFYDFMSPTAIYVHHRIMSYHTTWIIVYRASKTAVSELWAWHVNQAAREMGVAIFMLPHANHVAQSRVMPYHFWCIFIQWNEHEGRKSLVSR